MDLPPTIALILRAASAGTGFVAYERRRADPMLDLSLFRRSPFATGVASGLLALAVLFGTMFIVPFFLVHVRGASPGQVGLVLAVLPLALGCVAPVAGKMAEHVGTRSLTVVGMTLTSAMLALSGLTQPSGALLIGELGLVGVGVGLFIAPNNAAIMASAPRAQAGMAGGVLNMTRGLGTALGLALAGLVFGAVVADQTSESAASKGFAAAALFLALVALVAALLAARLPRLIWKWPSEDADARKRPEPYSPPEPLGGSHRSLPKGARNRRSHYLPIRSSSRWRLYSPKQSARNAFRSSTFRRRRR